jgi:NAD-dependent DNA ligase
MSELFLSKKIITDTFGTLLGLTEGIYADKQIRKSEVDALANWLIKNVALENRQPFSSIFSAIKDALADGVLTEEELKDIQFVCKNVLANYGDNELKKIRGLASGISSDGELNESEWSVLQQWVKENIALKGAWPYDEIETLAFKHIKTANLTSDEHHMIVSYFNDFCGISTVGTPTTKIHGICSLSPDIDAHEKVFCVTGKSKKFSDKEITDKIMNCGGTYKTEISTAVDYLIVCSNVERLWHYSCSGRKVELAMELRKTGHSIQLIHEFDFLDYVEDAA